MTIDIKNEKVIPVRRVPNLLGPVGRNDSKPHVSSIMRAVLRGDLEAYKFGSSWLTSVEAVQRWLEAQAATAMHSGNKPAPAPSSSRRAERAGRELTKRGI